MFEKELEYLKSSKVFAMVSTGENSYQGIITDYDDCALLLKEFGNKYIDGVMKETGVKSLVRLKAIDAIVWEYSKDIAKDI